MALATTPRTPRGVRARSLIGSSRLAGWPYSAVAGRATTTLATAARRAASSTLSTDVNERPSWRAEASCRGSTREVVHLPRPAQGDQLRQLLATGVEGADAQLARGRPGGLGAGVGEVGQRPGGQVVDDVDGATLGDQPLDEVRADEPGAADDQHAAGRRRHSAGWGTRLSATRSPSEILPSAPTTARTTCAPAPT